MKQSEAKHFLPIIKAWSEGKTLQLWDSTDKVWRDCTIDPIFTSKPELYRIKPEPRTQDVYVYFYPDGSTGIEKEPFDYVHDHTKVVKVTAVFSE